MQFAALIDTLRLRQALLDRAGNAVKFTDEGTPSPRQGVGRFGSSLTHSKGAAATIGAFPVRDRALDVEMAARAGRPEDQVAALIDQLEAELIVLERELRTFRREHQGEGVDPP